MSAQHTAGKQVNGIDMEILGDTVKAVKEDPDLGKSKFRVRNRWLGGNRNRTTVCDFHAAKEEHAHKRPYEMSADEPPMLAGKDEAPNPVEHLLNALAACLTTSMAAHAAVRGIHIEELESEVEGDIDLNGFLGLSQDVPKGYSNIRVRFRVKTDEANLERLKRCAAFSPVFNTVTHGAPVDVSVERK